jgi:chloride channel protein, CIC family
MMAGTMRSPLTGIFFMLELTQDFKVMPELIIGSLAALATTVLLLKRSILTEKLARRGQHISREYSVDLFELMRVADVMDTEAPIVDGTTSVGELSERISKSDSVISRRQATLIVDANSKLVGIITRGDLFRALQQEPAGKRTVLAAGKTNLEVTFPDETLDDAIGKMLKLDIGRLPVVSREDVRKIVGYLGRADILEARLRRHEEEELRERGPLRDGGAFSSTRGVCAPERT